MKELDEHIDSVLEEVMDDKNLFSEIKLEMLNGNFLIAREKLENISDKENSEYFLLLGIIERNLGNLDLAKKAFNNGVRIDSSNPEFFTEIGSLYFFDNHIESAIFYYKEALSLDPKFYNANLNLGLIYRNTQDYQKAKRYFNILTRAYPNQFLPFYNLGFCNEKLNKLKEAKDNYLIAIRLKPTSAESHFALGNIYKDEKKWKEAENEYLSAIENGGKNSKYYSNLGFVYHYWGKFVKAQETLELALAIDQNDVDAKLNLASTLFELDKTSEAIKVYDEIIKSGKNGEVAHFNKSLVQLYCGKYKEGFKNYEWRKKSVFREKFNNIQDWNGEDLNQKSILVLDEQGMGDFLQFSRFIFLLKEKNRNAEIKVYLRENLTNFVLKTNLSEFILTETEGKRKFDYKIDLLSLPYFLNQYLIKTAQNYFGITSKKDFIKTEKQKIGIVWRGNPNHMYDFKRSLKIENFIPFFSDEFEFYSFQKEVTEKEKSVLRIYNVNDLSEHLTDFYETAEFINSMDLIIAVDTAVAHLSGILQKETWLLLPKIPDWRWQRDGENSVWYKSVKLFRQSKSGDWNNVFNEITKLLSKDNLKQKILQKKVYAIRLLEKNEIEKSKKLLEEILTQNPHEVQVLNLLGYIAKEQNKEEAIEYFSKSLKIEENIEILKAKSILEFETRKLQDAKNSFGIILKAEKTAEIYNYLGLIYQTEEEFEKAISVFNKAIEIEQKAGYFLNLANNLFFNKQFDEALIFYEKAIQIENLEAAKIGRGLVNLARKNFIMGFKDFVFSLDNSFHNVFSQAKLWNGENLEGKSIFVYGEQGLGDSIQFARFLKNLKEMNCKIVFGANKATENLFKTSKYIDLVVTNGTIATDYFVSLLDLPRILELNKESDFHLVDDIFDLKQIDTKIIEINKSKRNFGLVFESKSESPTAKSRSISFEKIKSLFEIPNSYFYIIQKEISDDVKQFCNENSNKSTIVNESLETVAKLIEKLELVISVDSAICHISGSLQKKTLLLVPYTTDWRWGISDEISYWYPETRIIRQNKVKDWSNVIEEVNQILLRKEKRVLSLSEIRNLLDKGENEKADFEIRQALNKKQNQSDEKELLFLGGYVNQLLEKKEEAVSFYTTLLGKFDPDINSLNNLAVLLKDLGQIEKSRKILLIALQIDPNSFSALNNLGLVEDLLGNFDSAIQKYKKAISLNPNYTDALLNLGNTLTYTKRYDEALAVFDRILEFDKNNVGAKFNKALVYLSQKDYKKGFNFYESRKDRKDFLKRNFLKPELTNQNIEGKTIFVYDEQGYGDTIQFGRFINELANRGAKVVLQTHASLAGLMTKCNGVSKCLQRIYLSEPEVEYDYHIPLLTLPKYLGITENEIKTEKYINLSLEEVREKSHLFDNNKINIGLVWEGKTPISNAHRSIPLTNLKPILNNDKFSFHSLQIDEVAKRDSQLISDLGIVDLSNEIKSFSDTAKIIENLDLVITIDTSIAHLTGALGKRGIVLLSEKADWRWEDGISTSWYSSLELISQQKLNNWNEVVEILKNKMNILEMDFEKIINNKKRSYTNGLSY